MRAGVLMKVTMRTTVADECANEEERGRQFHGLGVFLGEITDDELGCNRRIHLHRNRME